MNTTTRHLTATLTTLALTATLAGCGTPEPETITVTETVEVEVDKPVPFVPDVCLTALDNADTMGLHLANTLLAAYDAFDAIERGDLAALTDATDRSLTLVDEQEQIQDEYLTARDECRQQAAVSPATDV